MVTIATARTGSGTDSDSDSDSASRSGLPWNWTERSEKGNIIPWPGTHDVFWNFEGKLGF